MEVIYGVLIHELLFATEYLNIKKEDAGKEYESCCII